MVIPLKSAPVMGQSGLTFLFIDPHPASFRKNSAFVDKSKLLK